MPFPADGRGAFTVPTVVALTDNSGGIAADTIPAQTSSYVEATQETTVASLAAKCNQLRTQNLAIIAALRAAGILSE